MKLKLFLLLVLLTSASLNFAQIQGDGGRPMAIKSVNVKSIDPLIFEKPDIDALRAEDVVNDMEKTGPWRFGFNHNVLISMNNSGQWYDLTNGGKVWLLKIKCTEALTINLSLRDVKLPEGNELYVYNEEKTFILGKFTSKHLYEGTLGTELVPGDLAIVEYYVAPNNSISDATLTIETVTHGYRTASEFSQKAFGGSASCNMNVICPDGSDWENEIKSVVMLVSGSNGFCSGALVNNTALDGKPYVLTANHCYSNPTNWIFRFNWQSATCTNPSSSPTFQSLSGAVLRARRTPTDFCLVEITGGLSNGMVPESYNAKYAGWDRSGAIPSSTVGIHHPSGDIKKISFDDNAAVISQGMNSTEANSTWTVIWNRNTTTEGGSSGSPLFDNNHRIIGQLWGGQASCSNLTGPDYYGRFSQSWEPASSNSSNQLKYWLDPANSGNLTVDTFDPYASVVQNDAGIQTINSPSGSYCTSEIAPTVTLRNYGSEPLTSVTINYSGTNLSPQSFSWTGNLAPGASSTISLPSFVATDGSNTFIASTSNPNGVADENTNNDSKTVTYTAVHQSETIIIKIRTDCYGSESSWEIHNESSVIASGGSFSNATEYNNEVCLPAGCYTFKMIDSYGDGMTSTSNFWNSCNATNVGYWVEYNSNNVVTMTSASFGYSASHEFCVGNASPADPCDTANPIEITGSTVVSSGYNGAITTNVTGGIQPYSYNWTGPNGYSSTSATIGSLAPGQYTLTVTDDCGITQTMEFTVESSVGLENVQAMSFNVYPNPSTGNFTVEFSNENIDSYTITVMDLTGRIIHTVKDNSKKKQINLSSFASGKYILTVKSAHINKNVSLIIK